MYKSSVNPLKVSHPNGADKLEPGLGFDRKQTERFEEQTISLMIACHKRGMHYCCDPLEFDDCANVAAFARAELNRVVGSHRNVKR